MALSFGTQQNTQTPFGGFSFGATNSTQAQNLSAQPSTTNTLGTPFGGFGAATSITTSNLFGNTQTAPAFSTSLFASNTTTTNSLFPTTAASVVPAAGSFSGFGNPTTNTSVPFGTGTLLPTTTVSSVGLGGVDVQTSGVPDGMSIANKKDGKTIKESQIPTEIMADVESFKKYVKEQKAIWDEMSRASNKSIFKIQEQVNNLKQQLSAVSNGFHRIAMTVEKTKKETKQESDHSEIGLRNKDSLSSQYESNAPNEYFHNLANSFEKQMQSYRQQIEQLERHLLAVSQPCILTPDEWTANRRRLHDTFVTLAAQLQVVHQEIQVYKDHFINKQRINQGDLKEYLEKVKQGGGSFYKHLTPSHPSGPRFLTAIQSDIGKTIIHAYDSSKPMPGSAASYNLSQIENSTAGKHLTMALNTSRMTTFQSTSPFKPLGK